MILIQTSHLAQKEYFRDMLYIKHEFVASSSLMKHCGQQLLLSAEADKELSETAAI